MDWGHLEIMPELLFWTSVKTIIVLESATKTKCIANQTKRKYPNMHE